MYATRCLCLVLAVWLVRVVGLGSEDPEFKSHSALELIQGGIDSACHPSKVSKMSAGLLVSCVGVAIVPRIVPNSQGDYLGSSAQSLVPMDGWNKMLDPYIMYF